MFVKGFGLFLFCMRWLMCSVLCCVCLLKVCV